MVRQGATDKARTGADDGQSLDMEDSPDPCRGCRGTYRVVMALLVRGVLLVHAVVAVWLLVSLTGNTMMWCLLATIVLLVVETFFTLVKRGGRESKWICPCFLAYLAAVLPPIWLVELYRLQTFNDALDKSDNLTSLVQVNGLTVPIKLEPDIWVSVMEQALLFLLVLGRWLLPRGDITRHELSQLLFVFMGIASDNMELFELFDETEVRKDPILTYVVLGVWSLSLLQFVFVLTATKNASQKMRVIHDQPTAEELAQERKKRRKRSVLEVMFATEIWSLLFSVMVQDGPYAATRIYTLVKYDLLTYSIIFFICKNILVICLVFYRLTIICVHKCTDDDSDEEEDAASDNSESRTGRTKRLLTNTRSMKVEPVAMTSLHSNTDNSSFS